MGASVVIVDDDARFREVAAALLAARGYRVVGTAASEISAVETVERVRPEWVLVDVELGEDDGVATARRLRGLPARPVVLLTSAGTGPVSMDEALPFVAKHLLATADLETLLSRAGR